MYKIPGELPSELDLVLADVVRELDLATAERGVFPTPFHGLAVIEEEVDEFKTEVRHGTRDRQRAEAVQATAMLLRFLLDF